MVNKHLCSIPPSWATPVINIMAGESCDVDTHAFTGNLVQRRPRSQSWICINVVHSFLLFFIIHSIYSIKYSLVQLTQPLYFPRLTAPVHGLAAQWESKCPGWHRPGHIRNSLIVWAGASLGAEHPPRHTYISHRNTSHLQMDFPSSGKW